ncbi:MAG: hypothetical protein KJ726_06850, partial [Verrucomicrobia bacterium]|nr:hypothetical protein [Verrucomicrobiota bacterium]
VTNGIYYLPQTVEIERGMTVQGLNGWSNTVVDGQQTGSCFYLETSNIVVDGFTITNGYWDFGGGVLVESLPPVTVQNCLITGNRAIYIGGGVASADALTITQCQIIGNEVMDYLGQGGGVAVYGEILMEDCVVQGNTATNGSGGGSWLLGPGLVQRCVISSNSSAGGGGGVFAQGIVISNCQIFGNQAVTNSDSSSGVGGGVAAGDFLMEQSQIVGNLAENGGGGVYIAGTGLVQQCVISSNRAEHGGGVYVSQWAAISNCQIIGNEAIGDLEMGYDGCGGGVAVDGDFLMEDCLVIGNTATNGGGGVFISENGLVQRCVINSNRAAYGGGLYTVLGGTVSNCQVVGNQAVTNSDSYSGFGGGVLALKVTVEDSLVDGNTAFHGGGMLAISGRVERCTISGNIADLGGGLVSGFFPEMILGDTVVRGCTIAGNQAISTNVWDVFGGGAGAMFLGGILQDCTITGNVSVTVAGGLWCALTNTLVENCTIADNEAEGEGAGGILIIDGSVARNCLITRNIGALGGGMACIMLGVTTSQVENCTIAGNTGGGLYALGGAYRNTIISSNDLNWYGNGFFESCCTTPTNGLDVMRNCIDADPQFVDTAAGNYRLQGSSPCVNTGTNQAWMAGAVDLDGHQRISGLNVDMGAYENMPVIVALAGEHGTIAPSGAVAVVYGSNQAFVVTADLYYHIEELLTNGAPDI